MPKTEVGFESGSNFLIMFETIELFEMVFKVLVDFSRYHEQPIILVCRRLRRLQVIRHNRIFAFGTQVSEDLQ